jgi:hypothetical protein
MEATVMEGGPLFRSLRKGGAVTGDRLSPRVSSLRAILDGYPMSGIEDLMPWHFRKASTLAA